MNLVEEKQNKTKQVYRLPGGKEKLHNKQNPQQYCRKYQNLAL